MVEFNLEKLKQEYSELKNKFNLPEFDELNRDFNIEKIADSETDILIREIRRFIADKFSNYSRFIETILNPANSSMFIFSVIKALGVKEKEKLEEIYKILVKNEIKLIELDIKFDEKKEVEFIKDACRLWKDVQVDLLEIIDVIKKNWDNQTEKNNKGYFG